MSNIKTLTSKQIYQNPWIEVLEDRIQYPNESIGKYSYVRISKPSVAIIPVEQNGIYLIKNYRYVIDEYSLEIPCGAAQGEGNLLDTAKRELKEELGFEAVQWTRLSTMYTLPFITDDVITYFIAEGITKGQSQPDKTEIIDKPHFYTLNEVDELIKQNKITQNVTLSGILLVMRYLETRKGGDKT